MGKMKKTIELALLSTVLASCGGLSTSSASGSGSGSTAPGDLSTLYVSNFNGGFGDSWLKKAISRFEKDNQNVSFESGKKGVHIEIQDNKTDAITLESTLKDSLSDVFFAEGLYYYDYIAQNLLLDVSDIVEEKLTGYGETRSIADKMTSEQRSFYQTTDGKYYGIPHYSGFSGLIYDVDLFDEDNLYFADGSSSFITSSSDKKSAGPDGISGTLDDGLPSTYDQFFQLCSHMAGDLGITPLIWNGQYSNTYLENLIYALMGDYEGLGNMMMNYTFSGISKNIINPVNSDGEYTFADSARGVQIQPNNAYELYANAGRYEALNFLKKLVSKSDYYYNLSFSPSFLHTEAQLAYLESRPKGQPIAMLSDGCWWEEEADANIQQIADFYGEQYSRMNRHFGWMPLPKANQGKVGQKPTLVDTLNSLGFIKANATPSKIPLAKKFLQYVSTDESLREFTTTTNTLKALDYKLTNEDLAKLSPFGATIYEAKCSSDMVYPYSNVPMYIDNVSYFNMYESFASSVGGTLQKRPIQYFRANQANSAADYFNGMRTYRESVWSNTFSEYFVNA